MKEETIIIPRETREIAIPKGDWVIYVNAELRTIEVKKPCS